MIAFSKADFAAAFLVVQQAAANPICVWNQAYQENWDADSYSEILEGALTCYTLVDPFNGEVASDTAKKIQQLKNNGNTVGCYISSGTCEAWRNDYDDMKDHCVDKQWGEWDGEYFVYDIDGMLPHMKTRIDHMAAWGCDYVEFDNMDWCTDTQYRNNYGDTPGQEFPPVADCVEYNKAMCDHARGLGVKCMAKNSGYTEYESDYAGGDYMDAVTIESYRTNFNWWSDSHLQGFLDANKPAIIVHYNARSNNSNQSCDAILNKYQQRYNSDKISFICEAKPEKKYIHYEWEPPTPTDPPTESPTKEPTYPPTKAPTTPTIPPTDSPTKEPTNPPTKAPITPSTDPFEIFLYNLNTQKGYQSTDQDISVLSTLELTGANDNWDTYIELGRETGNSYNSYRGVFFFQVPSTYDLASYNSLKLTVNYFGPGDDGYYVDTRWRFQIRRYDYAASKWKWTDLGNSGSMQDWVWSLVEFPLDSSYVLEDIVDVDVVKIRIKTAGNNDDICDIDYLKLSFE